MLAHPEIRVQLVIAEAGSDPLGKYAGICPQQPVRRSLVGGIV